MIRRTWVNWQILASAAILGVAVTEFVFFLLSQSYQAGNSPDWANLPWWVVLIRSVVPLLVYRGIKYARLCDRRARHAECLQQAANPRTLVNMGS
jgi:hypothetical protein